MKFGVFICVTRAIICICSTIDNLCVELSDAKITMNASERASEVSKMRSSEQKSGNNVECTQLFGTQQSTSQQIQSTRDRDMYFFFSRDPCDARLPCARL